MNNKPRFLLFTISLLLFFHCGAQLKSDSLAVGKVGAQALPKDIAPIEKTPFDMPQLQRPVFPSLTVNIADRGAKAGEPITAIVNQTIDEVSKKGGGTVVIPAGQWKSNRMTLKSNVNLHFAKGAEVEFGGKAEDYLPPVFARHEGIEIMGPAAFIYANGENNIAVTGEGKILGPPMDAEIRKRPNGASVVENDIPFSMPVEQRIYDGMEGRTFYRPKTIAPISCTNVLIEGVTIERAVHWNVCPIYCENVIIRGVTVSSVKVPSGDGMDIESCKNVLIEYCTLSCGDDCFTLKAGRAEDGLRVGRPTENVVIRYSLAQHGHGGITCGSETAGVVKNVYAHDCVFDGTRSAIRFKTRRNRGGGVESIFYERLRMKDVNEAFTFDLLGSAQYMGELAARYPERAVNKLTPTVKNIQVKDFTVENANRLMTANGIPEIPLSGVLIEDGEVSTKQLIRAINDADGMTLRNLKVKSQDNRVSILDGRNILFDNVKISTPKGEVEVSVEGAKSKNIVFRKVNPRVEVVEYAGKSPLVVRVKDDKIVWQKDGVTIRVAPYKGDKACAISYTFDDGLREHYTLVFPELEKRGFKGTFWINGSKVNEGTNRIADTTRVTWIQLKEMSNKGHEISNHGWEHKNFGRFSLEEIKEDVTKNDSAIFAHIGIMPATFCYPNNNKSNSAAVKFVSENRVGTRTQQVAIGSKSTREKLEQWTTGLVTFGEWGVGMTHGITYGYDAFGAATPVFWQHMDAVKARADSIWVGTFREVAAYSEEFKHIQCRSAAKKNAISITPELPLDKKLFTEPLTMVVELQNSQKITVAQGGRNLPTRLFQSKVLFDFNPYGGEIKVEF